MAKKRRNVTCKNCKKKVNTSFSLCPHCGAKLKSNISLVTLFFIACAVVVLVEILRNREVVFNDFNKIRQKFSIGSEANESVDIPNIEEEEIYKGNNVSIVAKNVGRYEKGVCLNLEIANNSALSLAFNAKAYAVNGIMLGTNSMDLDCNVLPRKKEYASLKISNQSLDKFSVEQVKYIDIMIGAVDVNNKARTFDTGQIQIKTNFYNGNMEVLRGQNIYDNNGIKVDFLRKTDTSLYFWLENTSGKYIEYDMDNICINDKTKVEKGNEHLKKRGILNNCQEIIYIKADNNFLTTNKINRITSIDWKMRLSLDTNAIRSRSVIIPIRYVP